VLGVLNVAGYNPDQFTAEDLEMLDAIGRQIGVAIENASLLKELKRKEELRGQLLRKVIMAQEEERRRIALELHDETSQSMASLVVGLKAAQAALSIDPVRSGEILSGLRATVSQTVKELHNVVYDLRPTLLDDLGLIPALRWYAETRLTAHGVEVELEVQGQPRRLPSEAEITLFRIAQEALTNIVRHAGASQVRLALEFGDEAAAVDIRDNGRGFDVRDMLDTDNGRQGFGLLGIQERAALLGGTFDVRSEPGEGTNLLVWVPVSRPVGDDGQDTDSTGR
jgi:signal transduction histidine kinase